MKVESNAEREDEELTVNDMLRMLERIHGTTQGDQVMRSFDVVIQLAIHVLKKLQAVAHEAASDAQAEKLGHLRPN